MRPNPKTLRPSPLRSQNGHAVKSLAGIADSDIAYQEPQTRRLLLTIHELLLQATGADNLASLCIDQKDSMRYCNCIIERHPCAASHVFDT